MVIKCLLCARHGFKWFTWTNSGNPHSNLMVRVLSRSQFYWSFIEPVLFTSAPSAHGINFDQWVKVSWRRMKINVKSPQENLSLMGLPRVSKSSAPSQKECGSWGGTAEQMRKSSKKTLLQWGSCDSGSPPHSFLIWLLCKKLNKMEPLSFKNDS